ncbi:MAG: ATP-binding protein involved in chromosome partitioning [Pseudohongiellaceae bacterium]|jgi:ATP-binding protein involved in chromosome partitioning
MTSLPSGVKPVHMGQDGPGVLVLRWSNDAVKRYVVRDLRLACRCAECIDEWTNLPRLDPETVPVDVHPLRIEPVGLYGLQVAWSDGHGTGIYTFDILWELGSTESKSSHPID